MERALTELMLAYLGMPANEAKELHDLLIPLRHEPAAAATYLADRDEVLFFANVGKAVFGADAGIADDDEDDEDDVAGEEELKGPRPDQLRELHCDTEGALSLHIDGETSAVTLGLRAAYRLWSPMEFALMVDAFREEVEEWRELLAPVGSVPAEA